MRMDPTSFAAERRAALHCEELVARLVAPADNLAAFAQLGQMIAPRFAQRLEGLFQSGAWDAKLVGCEAMVSDDLASRVGPLAGNFLLPVGDAGGRLFASFALSPLAGRLARLFGGDDAPPELSANGRLPSSMVMLLRRLERSLVAALSECLDEAAVRQGEASRFEPEFARLALFSTRTEAAAMAFHFTAEGGPPLNLLLACRKRMLGRLLSHRRNEGEAGPQIPERVEDSIADIPLAVQARLAELRLPVRRLMNLRPGQVLPLSVPRSVPLIAGGRVIATGTVGEQDDRVAVQLEQIMLAGDTE